MMVLDHRQHYLENVRAVISTVIYPVQMLVSFPVSAGNWMGENLSTRETLLEQNEALHSQNMMLKAQMQKYVSLEIENMRLRRLLDASERLGERILAAELISVDLDPFSHRVVVNKGSRHGIFVGQPLLDADGVYGQVVHVGPLSSTVMLITDPAHALPVQVSRTGLRAIAAGTGGMDRLDLLHIPNNADVAEGDLLISSGLGGVFPAGYPVGIVQSIKIDTTQPYAAVVATPLAELDKSREVMIVWKADALTPAPAVTPVESIPHETTGSEITHTP